MLCAASESSRQLTRRRDIDKKDLIDNSIRRVLETVLLSIYIYLWAHAHVHTCGHLCHGTCGGQRTDNLECRLSLCTCGFYIDSGDPNPSQRLTWQTLYPLSHLSRPRISCWNHLCPALRDSILYKNPLFKDCALHCEIPFHKQHLTPSQGRRMTLHLSGHINNTICLGPFAGHKVKNNMLLKIERAPLCELVKTNWDCRGEWIY